MRAGSKKSRRGSVALATAAVALASLPVAACNEDAATATGTPLTGILVQASALTEGLGCGPKAGQVYKYLAVVAYDVEPPPEGDAGTPDATLGGGSDPDGASGTPEAGADDSGSREGGSGDGGGLDDGGVEGGGGGDDGGDAGGPDASSPGSASSPALPTRQVLAGGLYDCFADANFMGLQPSRLGSLDFVIALRLFDKPSLDALTGDAGPELDFTRWREAARSSGYFAWTHCKATQQNNIQVLAACEPLRAAPESPLLIALP